MAPLDPPREPSAFLVLWARSRLDAAEANGKIGQPIPALFGGPHTSHPSLRRYRVCSGDRVFPVSVRDGRLLVICCAVVEAVYDLDVYLAARHAPNGRVAVLEQPISVGWTFLAPTCTDDVATLRSATPLRADRPVPGELLADLRVLTRRGERPVTGIADGRVKYIAGLQGHYFRLAPATAALFESLSS